MKICFIGPVFAISPHGTGGAENLIKRKISIENLDANYLLLDKSKILMIDDAASSSKFLGKGLYFFAKELFISRKKVVFSPVGLPILYRIFVNILVLLRMIRVHRVLFNYPSNQIKRFIYFLEAICCSTEVAWLSKRQSDYLKKLGLLSWVMGPKIIFQKAYVSENYQASINKFEDKFVVSFVGRFDVDKGAFETIELFSRLCCDPRLKLNFVYLTDGLTEKAKLALSNLRSINPNNCEIIPVDKYKINERENEHLSAKVLGESDVFIQAYHVLNSAIDAPLLLYEAAAAGCFIITRDVEGVSEHLKEKFWLQSGNIEDFVGQAEQQIKRLIDEKFNS